jgi:hypothetical protein
MAGAKLPTFDASETPLWQKLNTMGRLIEERLQMVERPLIDPRSPTAGEEVYVMTGVVEKRTMDASIATATDVANVLGTFLEDLLNEGRLR